MMNAVLIQLAVLLGGLVAGISIIWNLSSQMDLLTAVFRAVMVFFATVIVLFLFLRYFSMIMVKFVSEQVLQRRNQAAKGGGNPSGTLNSDPDRQHQNQADNGTANSSGTLDSNLDKKTR